MSRILTAETMSEYDTMGAAAEALHRRGLEARSDWDQSGIHLDVHLGAGHWAQFYRCESGDGLAGYISDPAGNCTSWFHGGLDLGDPGAVAGAILDWIRRVAR